MINKPIEEENPLFFDVENIDDHDSHRLDFRNDIELDATDSNVSTPSPIVLGRYAKKKDHWNFIQKA